MRKLFILTIVLFPFISFTQQDLNLFLIARNSGQKILSNNDTIRTFGFAQSLNENPGVPGPTLIMNQGDSVHIDLWNVSQGAPHTIHLHGLDVNQQNDGVPHLSFDIAHMDHGYYHFKAPHAGTYLYHCHVASTIHVQAGMYGLIIVKPSDGSNTTWDGGYSFEQEHSYFLSEIDTNWHVDSVLMHEHDTSLTIHSVKIPQYDPQFFLINGMSDQQLIDSNIVFESAVNQMDYTRLANIGFYGVRVIFPSQLNAKIIDSDGRPFSVEEISDTVMIYPGERFGVLTESSLEFNSQISYEYFDLNTMNTAGVQIIPVSVSGFAGEIEIESKPLEISIEPNPFVENTELTFYLSNSKDLTLTINDLNGNLIYSSQKEYYSAGKQKIDLTHLIPSEGVYFVTLKTDKGILGVQKLIKI